MVFRIAALARQATIEVGVDGDEVDQNESDAALIDADTGCLVPSGQDGVKILYCNLVEDRVEKRLYLRQCQACGKRAGRYPEPISSLHPGDDAIAAVTTQVVLEALPEADRNGDSLPMAGRKVLVFSDNRQDAAFFAPFFQRTSLDLALRACITNAVLQADNNDGISFGEATEEVWYEMGSSGQSAFKLHHQGWDSQVSDKLAKRGLAAHVVAEFCTGGLARVSLESLGIVGVTYDRRSVSALAKAIVSTDVTFDHRTAKEFAELALDLIRRRRAIHDSSGRMDLTDAAIWGPHQSQKNRCFVLSKPPRAKATAFGILPAGSRGNRFTWLLEDRLGQSPDLARRALSAFWHCARSQQLLVKHSSGVALNLDKVRILPGTRSEPLRMWNLRHTNLSVCSVSMPVLAV